MHSQKYYTKMIRHDSSMEINSTFRFNYIASDFLSVMKCDVKPSVKNLDFHGWGNKSSEV